jgi:uncharacterized coiled-coil protein SlyX
MIKNKLFQLAKLILKLASLETTDGIKLVYEDSLTVGTEVFIEEEGELKPAPDAEYRTTDKIIVVKEGKVESLEEVAPEETTEEVAQEEATEDPRIAELEAQLAEKEAIIKELEEKIKQLEEDKTKSEEEMKMSVAKPAKEQIKEVTVKNSELKFYQFQ